MTCSARFVNPLRLLVSPEPSGYSVVSWEQKDGLPAGII
jgi:hypothetical protein